MLTLTTAKCATHASIAQGHMATVAYAMCQPIVSGCATNTNLRTRGIMTITSNSKVKMHDGMLVVGWVTVGYYGNDIGPTIYGVFETMEQAEDWLAKLQSGYTHIVFAPQYNRG